MNFGSAKGKDQIVKRCRAFAAAGLIASAWAATALGAPSQYEVFQWTATATGGNWSDVANWSYKGIGDETYSAPAPRAPGEAADRISFEAANGVYTVTLSDDVTVNSASMIKGTAANPTWTTIDLNGHFLTLKDYSWACINPYAEGSTARDFKWCYSTYIFKNGRVQINGGLRAGNTTNSGLQCGGFVFDNASFTGCSSSWCNSTRVFVLNGGVWTNTAYLKTSVTGSLFLANPLLCVSNANSRFVSPQYDVDVSGSSAGFYVLDGAFAETKRLRIGAVDKAVGCFVRVDNGTLVARGDLSIGSDDLDGVSGSTLEVAGASARIVATNDTFGLVVCEGVGAKFKFEVPRTGYLESDGGTPRAPVLARTLSFAPHNAEFADNGAAGLDIACFGWAGAHQLETIPLLELQTANAEGLAALAENVTFSDFPQWAIDRGEQPEVSVSADGKRLLLTAPEVTDEPILTASGSFAARKVTVNLVSYGFDATKAVSVKLVYANNALFENAVTVTLAENVSAALPTSVTSVIEGLGEHENYWCRVEVLNDRGKTGTATFEMGDAETLYWKSATSGLWENPENWALDSASGESIGQYPHAEDTARPILGTYTISANQDVDCRSLSEISGSSRCVMTMDLNGHVLTAHTPSNSGVLTLNGGAWSRKHDMQLQYTTFEILDGIYEMSSGQGISLGFNGGDVQRCASFVVGAGATLHSYFRYINNSSRIFVRDGGCLKVSAAMNMYNPYTPRAESWPFLCVTGANSRVESDYAFKLGTYGAGLYAQDGGYAAFDSVYIGTEHMSTNCFVRAENGTVMVKDLRLGTESTGSCNPSLEIAGAQALVAVTGSGAVLSVYEDTGAHIDIDVPVDGFAGGAPLRLNDLAFVARDPSFPAFGKFAINLSCRAWLKANRGKSIELVRFNAPNAEKLAALKARVVSDYGRFDAAVHLATSEDGCALCLNSPLNGAVILVR